MVKQISKYITNLFHFYTWFAAILIAGALKTGVGDDHVKWTFPLIFALDVICPIFAYLFLLEGGMISNSTLVKRVDRPVLFGVTTLSVFLATLISYFFTYDSFFKINLLIFAFMLTLFAVTLFFKISGHMFLSSYFVFTLNFLFGWNLLFLFLIVPIVALARLYLKAHTPFEVLAGILLGIVEPYLLLKLFNLL